MADFASIPASFPQRWVVMGVSGCGKSSVAALLAKRLGYEFVEGDEYHPRTNIDKMAAGVALTDEDRQEWLLTLQAVLRQSVQQGKPLVLTCSSLKRRYRDLLREADPALAFCHLYGERDLIASRMRQRTGHFMPTQLLDSQLRDLEPLQEDEQGIRLDVIDPPDVLVDQLLKHYQIEPGK